MIAVRVRSGRRRATWHDHTQAGGTDRGYHFAPHHCRGSRTSCSSLRGSSSAPGEREDAPTAETPVARRPTNNHPAARLTSMRVPPTTYARILRGPRYCSGRDGGQKTGARIHRDAQTGPFQGCAGAAASRASRVAPHMAGYGLGVWSPQGTFLYRRPAEDDWREAEPAGGCSSSVPFATATGRRRGR